LKKLEDEGGGGGEEGIREIFKDAYIKKILNRKL